MSQLLPNYLPNYIGGQNLDSASDETIPVINPATEDELCLIPDSDAIDVGLAVKVAKEALPEWRQTPPVTRARILFRFREQLEKYQKDLAAVISSEHGKTLDDAQAEISRAMDVVEFACGISQFLKESIPEALVKVLIAGQKYIWWACAQVLHLLTFR